MSDRFDGQRRLGRVGAHRAHEPRRWRWWMTALCAVVACGLLVGIGVVALSTLRVGTVEVPDVVAVEPSSDPATLPEDVTITVLDASGSEAGEQIEAQLSDAGWPVVTTLNADSEVVDSGVYYRGEELEPWALGLAEAVGGQAIASDDEITGSAITIVVGTGDGGPAPTSAP